MLEKQPTLYLMLGYPGAGKTTAAKTIHAVTGARHIWADQERQEMFARPKFGEKESTVLYDVLNRKAQEFLASGMSVVYDTNFNHQRDRDKLRSLAATAGARTLIVWVETPLDLAKTRATEDETGNHTRVWGNMSTRDFDRLSHVLEEPGDDEPFIKLDGTKINEKYIRGALELSHEGPTTQTS